MPTISRFHGIIIVMFLRGKEHEPPHVHAVMQDCSAPFLISDGSVMDNAAFPPASAAMVRRFVQRYREELEEMWETGVYRKLPPLE